MALPPTDLGAVAAADRSARMARMRTVDRVEAELRDFARLQVYAGLLDEGARRTAVSDAIRAELPQQATNADVLARAWLARAAADLSADAQRWPTPTDADRLDRALAECEEHHVAVLPGVADQQAATRALGEHPGLRGALWFTPQDVWHAIDHGVLELTLWHADGAAVLPDDPLMAAVTACMDRHGIPARAEGGRVQVRCQWQRRP